MDKLRNVIVEFPDWDELKIFIDRIESHVEVDFSHSLENAKALLEAIGKEVCTKNGVELNDTSTINGVMKQCFNSMGYTNVSMVQQVSRSLATIGQQVGNLRNEIGLTSHGKSLEEIKQRNSKVDVLTREFLIDTVETVCIFIIRNYETRKKKKAEELLEDTLEYWEAEDFNAFWDESFGEFAMGDYSYPASEILFNVDKQAFVNEYKTYTEDMKEKIIIALRGKGESGKTTTIVKLYSLLKERDFQLVESNIDRPFPDYKAIFKYKDLIIGITSKGDTYDDVSKDLKWLISKECHILICACRTKDRPNRQGRVRGSNTAINEYDDYETIRLNKTVSRDKDDKVENEKNNTKDAKRLLDELLSHING